MFEFDECCPTPLQDAAVTIAKHLSEFYNDRSHKDEVPTCIVCMAFFMGTQNADALE
jgi:hypothetical protein